MAAFRCACDQLHAGFPFGGTAVVVFKTKGRVAADLAYPCKFSQYFQLVFVKIVFVLVFQQFLHMHQLAVVQIQLLFLRFCVAYFFQFFRKIPENVFFQAAQDKGGSHLSESFGCSHILVFYNGCLKAFFEGFIFI